MSQIDIHKRKTDLAWNLLYSRLENDGLLPDENGKKKTSTIRIRAVRWAAAIAVLCISAASVYFIAQRSNSASSSLLSMHGEKATTLITTLEDGSVVYLGEMATLHYPEHFETNKREVVLEGNASFDISGNKERPFLIEAGKVQIEVLGTSFRVKNDEDAAFELAVKRGEVKVTVKGSKENCLVRAGERVTLYPDGLQISFLDDTEILDSHIERIKFKDERLADVLNVLNKEISSIPIITTPSLEDRRFTVAFEKNTPEQIAEVICLGLHLKYNKVDDKLLISEP